MSLVDVLRFAFLVVVVLNAAFLSWLLYNVYKQ